MLNPSNDCYIYYSEKTENVHDIVTGINRLMQNINVSHLYHKQDDKNIIPKSKNHQHNYSFDPANKSAKSNSLTKIFIDK